MLPKLLNKISLIVDNSLFLQSTNRWIRVCQSIESLPIQPLKKWIGVDVSQLPREAASHEAEYDHSQRPNIGWSFDPVVGVAYQGANLRRRVGRAVADFAHHGTHLSGHPKITQLNPRQHPVSLVLPNCHRQSYLLRLYGHHHQIRHIIQTYPHNLFSPNMYVLGRQECFLISNPGAPPAWNEWTPRLLSPVSPRTSRPLLAVRLSVERT